MTTDLPTLALAARGTATSAIRAVILGARSNGMAEIAILTAQSDARLLTIDEEQWRLNARAADVFSAFPRSIWRSQMARTGPAAMSYVGQCDLLVVTTAVGLNGALGEIGPWLPRVRKQGYVWIEGAGEYAEGLEHTIVAAGKLAIGPAAADGAWIGRVPKTRSDWPL